MSAFDTEFVADCQQDLLDDFGTDVERWPGGDHTAKVDEVWLIEFEHEQGDNSGLADKLPLDRKGMTADMFVTLIGANEIAVTDRDRFRFVHPATGANVVANAVRRIRAGAMQAWLCIIPNGKDTKHARVRM